MEKLLEVLDIALLDEKAVTSEPTTMGSASGVDIASPVPGAELRQASLCAFFVRGGVLHAAEHDSVERSTGAEKEVALGLAERAQRTKSKFPFQILNA